MKLSQTSKTPTNKIKAVELVPTQKGGRLLFHKFLFISKHVINKVKHLFDVNTDNM